ncbi:hypothetical protein AAH994_01955 [Weeksellaceae bacterium A-14]|uniref:hypothetical protein n=1 Tax=Daejeonia sp. YH14 TaxID=3439042 RepID=UPI0031E4A1E0
MKKLFATILLLLVSFSAHAQYAKMNAILNILEERKGINQKLEYLNIDHMKFVMVKDFPDHTERDFVIFNGGKATYVEIFDDKETGKSTSNVFSGDYKRSRKNIISVRCDKLEGKQIPIPVTKTYLLTRQKDITYLIDTNNRERWIDQNSWGEKSR